MKYMLLIAADDESYVGMDDAAQAALYERISAWWDERAADGRILEGHQLQGTDTATTVRVAVDGATTVTDGPFIEAKESVGGYAIIDVPDLDAAIALARSWPAPDALEIRPVVVRSESGA